MSEIPTAVSESTAIEIVRTEGSTRSFKCVDNTVTAGDLIYIPTASGATKATSGQLADYQGVALYTCASGNRLVTIRGKVRSTWDGNGTAAYGSPIGISVTHSGWFEISAAASGANIIGSFLGNGAGSTLAAANSGTLQVVALQ